jgi:aerobic carbon-monoxide dehydrogenase medium subunit
MTTSVLTPKTVSEVVKLVAKYGKRALFVSGVDPASEKIPTGKVVIDLTNVDSLNEISAQKDRVVIGTGMNLGKLAREVVGESSLIRQAASIIANPLVRNKITLAQALDPESPFFDITTPMVLLESKVRLQSPTAKRTINIRDFLEALSDGLKKGEFPVAIEFTQLPPGERVGFFRVARMGGKGTVSAAARMKINRNTCLNPEIVVSSLTLIPLRSKAAEKEIAGKPASEEIIKKASQMAAQEIADMAEKPNAYEKTLVEITVARTLRSIMEGSINK